MKELAWFALLVVLIGCGRNMEQSKFGCKKINETDKTIRRIEQQPVDTLPQEVRQFPVHAGMCVRRVKELLHMSAVDPSQPLTYLRGPCTDNAWSGIYTVEFRAGSVSRVSFSRGNLSVVTGSWTLSER